jgi:hypothetical protein
MSSFFKGHFQNAYVTHDLDKAMEMIGDRFGLKDYIVFEPDMILKTPQGNRESSVRAALGWQAGHQIELIQPVSGFLDHYLPYLPADKSDPTPQFHHTAVRRDDLEAMRSEIDRLGLPVLFEGEVPDLIFIYLDARQTLGHCFEYIWATPEGGEMQGWPEGRPIW